MKKLTLGVFLVFLLINTQSVLAEDGNLNLNTDSIANTEQKSVGNSIEELYAPNLFLDRTQKVVDKEHQDEEEMLETAESRLFTSDNQQSNYYHLDTESIDEKQFVDYQVDESYTVASVENSQKKSYMNSIVVFCFFVLMTIFGVFLGRIRYGIRKH